MKLQIRSHAFALGPAEKRHIERRFYIALLSFDRHIDETIISIRDVNGPRGGKDLQGQAIMRFRRGMPLVVRSSADNVHLLVSQLASAVRRAVKSRIRRRRTRWMKLYRRRQRPMAAALPGEASRRSAKTDDRAFQLVT
jgi:hypothetical protein